MLRRTQQRLSCGANTLALALVFGVVILHVLHRRSAANVGPGDDQNVVFWFEAGGLCSAARAASNLVHCSDVMSIYKD
jgi:hypothetical protein